MARFHFLSKENNGYRQENFTCLFVISMRDKDSQKASISSAVCRKCRQENIIINSVAKCTDCEKSDQIDVPLPLVPDTKLEFYGNVDCKHLDV